MNMKNSKKPYAVSRIAYTDAHLDGPWFVTARTPKEAAVEMTQYRRVHNGDSGIYLKVVRLEETIKTDIPGLQSKKYFISLRAAIDYVEAR